MPNIPYDFYESSQEFLVIVPFGGVDKSSITLKVQHETLTITGQRHEPSLRDDFLPLQQHCYRGAIQLDIDLPPNVRYKEMTSTLSKDNILTIILPKNTLPDSIPVQIEDDDQN